MHVKNKWRLTVEKRTGFKQNVFSTTEDFT